MSIKHHSINIHNNTNIVTFNSKELALSFFQLQLSAYKKCIELLKTFGTLLEDLSTRTFSIHDNESRVREIINNSVSVLYSNLLTTLTTVIRSKQLFNLSITSTTNPGYTVNVNIKSDDIKQNLSYKINSIRLQINTSTSMNMIKWVQNDSCNIPEMVSLIGHKGDLSLEKTIDEYKTTINLTIDKLKVHELSYINLINNFISTTRLK